jgi:hypothetical protein
MGKASAIGDEVHNLANRADRVENSAEAIDIWIR